MIKEREYLLSVTPLKRPKVLEGEEAIAMDLLRLILLNPGSDPLHPDMGVGIINYRYAMGKLDELKTRIQNQIQTYLPCYPAASIEIEITKDHLCNILISIDDVVYKYDSSQAPIPITLDTAMDNT